MPPSWRIASNKKGKGKREKGKGKGEKAKGKKAKGKRAARIPDPGKRIPAGFGGDILRHL